MGNLPAALAFSAVFLLVMVPLVARTERRRRLRAWTEEPRFEGTGAVREALKRVLDRLARLRPGGSADLPDLIRQAGEPVSLGTVYAVQAGGLVVALGFAVLGSPYMGTAAIGAAIAIGVASWFGPPWLLGWMGKRRRAAIRRSVVDFADLFATMLGAGLPLLTALERLADEFGGPLGQELKWARAAMDAGASATEALSGMAEAVKVEELTNLVASILQAQHYGTPLARVVAEQAESVRTVRRLQAQERGGKLSSLMMFGMLGILGPVMVLILLPNAGGMMMGQ